MADDAAPADDEMPTMTEGYVPPAKVDLNTMLEADADDEAMRKYKESLLGNMDAYGIQFPHFIMVFIFICPPRC